VHLPVTSKLHKKYLTSWSSIWWAYTQRVRWNARQIWLNFATRLWSKRKPGSNDPGLHVITNTARSDYRLDCCLLAVVT